MGVSQPQAPLGPKIPAHFSLQVCVPAASKETRGKGAGALPLLGKRKQAKRHPESPLESILCDNCAGQGCDSEHFTPRLNRHKETSQQLLTMISLGGGKSDSCLQNIFSSNHIKQLFGISSFSSHLFPPSTFLPCPAHENHQIISTEHHQRPS